jgi:hypothetical protein
MPEVEQPRAGNTPTARACGCDGISAPVFSVVSL